MQYYSIQFVGLFDSDMLVSLRIEENVALNRFVDWGNESPCKLC
jgi:hypothetical protein